MTKIAVLLPCYNESKTIKNTVQEFKKFLPNAIIYVCDNASTDNTAEIAQEAGAVVIHETYKGKGNAVRRLFSEVNADIYIMADGDSTYDASAAPTLITHLLENKHDMVIGSRDALKDNDSNTKHFRSGHRFGNKLFSLLVTKLFGAKINDLLSGYRVMSRKFVKTFAAESEGFEIETEITVHALQHRLSISEVSTQYDERPDGSVSKLNTYRDGLKILMYMLRLLVTFRPLFLFGILFSLTALTSLLLSIPIFINYIETGIIPNIPTAILVTGMMLLSFIILVCGLILDNISYARKASFRQAYLNIPETTTYNSKETEKSNIANIA